MEKEITYESAYSLYEGRELIVTAFKRGIFPIKGTQGKRTSFGLSNVTENINF